MKKSASSQAAWALLTEGVTSARVEAHRLRHLISRVQKLVEQSTHREHIEQIAGDILLAVPKRLDHLEIDLDRTAFALIKMGDEFLDARLPLGDKVKVEEAVMPAFGGGKMRTSANKVAHRWLQAVLAKVTTKIKTEFGKRAKRRGLDGNGRFPSIGRAINAIHDILQEEYDLGGGLKAAMELDDVPSADRFMGESGSQNLRIAFRGEDMFSPVPISNSNVVISWHYFKETDKYEVLAYLS